MLTDLHRQLHILERRQVLHQIIKLKNKPNILPPVLDQILAAVLADLRSVHQHLPRSRRIHSTEDIQHRRLPRTARSDHTHKLTLFHIKADPIRSLDRNLTHLIGLGYILKTHISRHVAVFLPCKKSIFPISFIVSIYSRGG